KHRFFNTHSLWVNLRTLQETMRERDGVLGLPMIVNRKTVDPGDADSTPVIQLESAMGAAIGVFEGAGALRVSRRRFAPVKTTNDLLALRSDAYVLTDDARVVLAEERADRGAPTGRSVPRERSPRAAASSATRRSWRSPAQRSPTSTWPRWWSATAPRARWPRCASSASRTRSARRWSASATRAGSPRWPTR